MTQSATTNGDASLPSFSANLAGKTAIVTGSSRYHSGPIALFEFSAKHRTEASVRQSLSTSVDEAQMWS